MATAGLSQQQDLWAATSGLLHECLELFLGQEFHTCCTPTVRQSVGVFTSLMCTGSHP